MGEENNSRKFALSILLLTILVIAVVIVPLAFFASLTWDVQSYYMSCIKYDGIVEEDWQKNESISNYGDLPKYIRENLSHKSRVRLSGIDSRWFDAADYESLSNPQRDNFRESITGEENSIYFERKIKIHHVFGIGEPEPIETVDSLVLYQNEVYYCDSGKVPEPGGA